LVKNFSGRAAARRLQFAMPDFKSLTAFSKLIFD
jgi:hypothetical protein